MPQAAGVVAFVTRPPGRPVTIRRLRPLAGATHVFGMPHTARGRLGCAWPSHPPVGSLPNQQSLAGRRNGELGRVPSRLRSAMPHSRPASRSADGSSTASKRPSTPSGKDFWPLATRRVRRRRVRKDTRPRTRTKPLDWWVASVTARPARAPRANGAVRPKHVPAPADGRERRCALLAARKCASTPRVVSALRYGSNSERSLRPVPPRTPWDAGPAFTTKQRFAALAGWPTSRTIHNTHYGSGGVRVSTGGASRFRACPTRPEFGGPRLRRCRCGQSRRPGPRLRGPPAGYPSAATESRASAKLAEPPRWFSRILAGATLRMSPARLTRGHPLDPGQFRAPDGVRGSQAVAQMGDALPVVAVPGRVRRPHGALRCRIGRGRSGQSDPLTTARVAFPQGISGSGATPEAVARV